MQFSLCFVAFLWFSGPLFARAEGVIVTLPDGKNYEVYMVRKGDTIWGIGQKKLADPEKWVGIIAPEQYVPTKNPNLIKPGQLIFIPVDAPAAVAQKGSSEAQDAGASETANRGNKTVAAVKFRNTGAGYDWLSVGLAEVFSTDLVKVPNIKVVERQQVEKIIKEKKLKDGVMDVARAREFGKALDAGLLLAGVYRVEHGQIEIEASLTNTDKGLVLKADKVAGKIEQIFELERMLLLKLISAVVPISDETHAAILVGEKTNLEAFEQASKGKALFYSGRTKEAKEYYQKALETDPKYRAALEELKKSVSAADSLAVMPFENATGRAELDWLKQGISESLSTDLRKLTSIFLVERIQVEKALEELKLGSMGGLVDEATAPKLGKMVGAGIVLVGSYQGMGDRLRVDVRMVDTASSQVLLSESAEGKLDDIFKLETGLAEKIAAALHVDLTPEQRKGLMAGKPDIESFKRYIMAQGTVEIADKKPDQGVTKLRAIALTDFTNATKNTSYEWLKTAIPGALTTDLRSRSKLSLVERTMIDKALEELKIASMGLVSAENAPQLGKMVGADAVLTGMYQITGETIRIDAKIIKVETGEVVSGGKAEGQVSDIFGLEKKLALDILAALGVKPEKDKDEAGKGNDPKKPEKPRVPAKAYVSYWEKL